MDSLARAESKHCSPQAFARARRYADAADAAAEELDLGRPIAADLGGDDGPGPAAVLARSDGSRMAQHGLVSRMEDMLTAHQRLHEWVRHVDAEGQATSGDLASVKQLSLAFDRRLSALESAGYTGAMADDGGVDERIRRAVDAQVGPAVRAALAAARHEFVLERQLDQVAEARVGHPTCTDAIERLEARLRRLEAETGRGIDELALRIEARLDAESRAEMDMDAVVRRVRAGIVVPEVDVDDVIRRVRAGIVVPEVDVDAVIRRVRAGMVVPEIDMDTIVRRVRAEIPVPEIDVDAVVRRVRAEIPVPEIDVNAVVHRVRAEMPNAKVTSPNVDAIVQHAIDKAAEQLADSTAQLADRVRKLETVRSDDAEKTALLVSTLSDEVAAMQKPASGGSAEKHDVEMRLAEMVMHQTKRLDETIKSNRATVEKELAELRGHGREDVDVRKLRQELANFRLALDADKIANAESRRVLTTLRTQVTTLASEVEHGASKEELHGTAIIAERAQRCADEVAQLSADLQHQVHTMVDLSSPDVEALTERIGVLEAKLGDGTSEWRSQVEALRHGLHDLDALGESRIVDIHARVGQMEARIDAFQVDDLARLRADLAAVRRSHDAVQRSVDDVAVRIGTLTPGDVARFRSQITDVDEMRKTLEQSMTMAQNTSAIVDDGFLALQQTVERHGERMDAFETVENARKRSSGVDERMTEFLAKASARVSAAEEAGRACQAQLVDAQAAVGTLQSRVDEFALQLPDDVEAAVAPSLEIFETRLAAAEEAMAAEELALAKLAASVGERISSSDLETSLAGVRERIVAAEEQIVAVQEAMRLPEPTPDAAQLASAAAKVDARLVRLESLLTTNVAPQTQVAALTARLDDMEVLAANMRSAFAKQDLHAAVRTLEQTVESAKTGAASDLARLQRQLDALTVRTAGKAGGESTEEQQPMAGCTASVVLDLFFDAGADVSSGGAVVDPDGFRVGCDVGFDDGEVTVRFLPPTAGYYSLHVDDQEPRSVFVAASPIDAAKCVVFVDRHVAACGSAVTVTIECRDHEGLLRARGHDMVHLRVRAPSANDFCYLRVSDNGDGTYTSVLVPDEAGQYVCIAATGTGAMMGSSPFAVIAHRADEPAPGAPEALSLDEPLALELEEGISESLHSGVLVVRNACAPLLDGDLVLFVDGLRTASTSDFWRALVALGPGRSAAQVSVVRDGTALVLTDVAFKKL